MRILRILTLTLISLHCSSSAQEEPIITPDEHVKQETLETTENQQSQQEIAEPTIDESVTVQKEDVEPQTIEIPAVPEPVIEEAIITTDDVTPQSPIGIDTVSLEDPQGNWLFKRIWWERAEEKYEKIRLLVDTIWRSRTEFFIKRNNLDRNILDPFYINTGLQLGELQIILSELIDSLEKQREKEGDLTESERESFESLITEQDALKQLKLDVDSIANLDHAIDNALDKLMQQINNARNFEAQAWTNFKEIAHILNDTRARELYYMIEGAARNIKNISTYLEQSFLKHFDTLIYETSNHITRVQQHMLALKEKGVIFKSQADQVALQEKEEKQQAEEAEAAEQEEEENKPKQKTGWINWIVANIKKGLSFIISIIRLPYDMIFGR